MDTWESGNLVLDFFKEAGEEATFGQFVDLFGIEGAVLLEADVGIKEDVDANAPESISEASTPFANAFKHPTTSAATHSHADVPTVSDRSEAYSFGLGPQEPSGQTGRDQEQEQQREQQSMKRRRVRNAEQMELNRQAQQRYRQRKKNEQNELQNTVDMLAAQIVAMQTLQQQHAELQGVAEGLKGQVALKEQQVSVLEATVTEQAARLTLAEGQVDKHQKLIVKQQEVILAQQQKMQLQDKIVSELKDKLRESIEGAVLQLSSVNPGSVCQVMINAVKDAILSAEDVNGIHSAVINMPDHMIHEISRRVLCACKQLWPELLNKCSKQHTCNGVAAVPAC